ncbi:sensor histidine kinase [Subtercola boreus]|uniref:Sensor-like histidine kinase SenX3 n=1 Tax=Subtercola boreus TaxID=120213 RepID=A0A3E0W9E4_9MICO|nr:ATP-binding protein [Subtercola boreus]RFA19331.1 two-component sensor histidine kinase [Subtercola boreus]RFA19592.1 two-component sensor histidine kinase [Subtercola boreus]RFA25957.1 two-component sensor histidine kinase [Subtercola boreus]
MDSGLLVLLSVALGLAVGSGFVFVLFAAARRGDHAATIVDPSVPDGVDQVIDAIDSAGVVLDASNNVVKVSPAALAFGLVWNHGLVHPQLVAMVDSVRRTGEPVSRDLSLARGPFGDATIHLQVRVARLGSRYLLLLADDRTEAHRLEEVRRDFIANISHELKTPIGAISLLAEALEPAADDPDQVRRFARRMETEAQRLGRITREIIELSRLQAADVLTGAELLDVDSIVASAIDQNHVQLDTHNVTIVSGGDAGTQVYGDEGLLVLALHNLIANAVQYSQQGTRVGVGVHLTEGVVEIAVTDQGIGIPEDDLGRVFERFFRVDQARSRNTGGTGLGLSIVKHVIENHGGDIRVWSQPALGSTFTIRLPAASHAAVASLGEQR